MNIYFIHRNQRNTGLEDDGIYHIHGTANTISAEADNWEISLTYGGTVSTLAPRDRFRYTRFLWYLPTDCAALSVSDKQDGLGGFDYVISQHENSFGVVPTDLGRLGNHPRNHRVFVRHFPLEEKALSRQRMSSLTFRHSTSWSWGHEWTGRGL